MKKVFHLQKGFSFLELLVVIMIMIIVFTTGSASFRGFQRRKALDGAILEIKSYLQFTRELALAGKKPTSASCDPLNGYNFSLTSNRIDLNANCAAGSLVLEKQVYLLTKYPDISVTTNFSYAIFYTQGNGVLFSPVSGPAPGQGVITVTQSGGAVKTVTISKSGEIN